MQISHCIIIQLDITDAKYIINYIYLVDLSWLNYKFANGESINIKWIYVKASTIQIITGFNTLIYNP